jgi:hypothetical protein
VGFDTPAVRLQQNIGADGSVSFRDTVSLEYVDHEVVDQIPLDIRSGFHRYIPPKNKNYILNT